MSDWPFGISTGCFYQTNILQALPMVRDGGFTLIEVCSFPAHLDYHNGHGTKIKAYREVLKSLV